MISWKKYGKVTDFGMLLHFKGLLLLLCTTFADVKKRRILPARPVDFVRLSEERFPYTALTDVRMCLVFGEVNMFESYLHAFQASKG